MDKSAFIIKGIHYRKPFIYNLQTKIKLRSSYNLRYKIAAKYIKAGDSVLDVCAGMGELKNFLPEGCKYICLEASPEFLFQLSQKNIQYKSINLHEGINTEDFQVDAVVMIISLYQFRNTSMHNLLEDFKKIAKKVVIVEEVLVKKRGKDSFVQKTINYLCATDYYLPIELFSFDEFEDVMQKHNYRREKYRKRYIVGYYNS